MDPKYSSTRMLYQNPHFSRYKTAAPPEPKLWQVYLKRSSNAVGIQKNPSFCDKSRRTHPTMDISVSNNTDFLFILIINKSS